MTGRRWRELGDWLRAQQRPFRAATLAPRWSEWTVREAIAQGAAVRMVPGIVAATECAAIPRVQGLALNLWHPNLVVTGALALHLFRGALAVPATADVLVPYGTRLAPTEGVRVFQRAPVERRQRPSGVWCAPPPRALIDAWHNAAPDHARDVVYEALWARACTAGEVLAELEAVPRVRARRELVRLLHKFTQGSTSPLEVFARDVVFAGKEWAQLEWQATLEVEGSMRRPDALHRAARVIIEFDGARWHGSSEARERDRLRDLELAALGYVTLRLTFADLRQRPDWCRATVREAIRRRTGTL